MNIEQRNNFLKENRYNAKFRYDLAALIEKYFPEELIKNLANKYQYDLSLIITLEYADYNTMLEYLWVNQENINLLDEIMDAFIIDKKERAKIFDIEWDINLTITNWKLKIRRDYDDNFADIYLENNRWITYHIVSSNWQPWKTNDNNYCKKYLLYILWVDNTYTDINNWISYHITKSDDFNYYIQIDDKEYMDNLAWIVKNIKPAFTNLPWENQKDMNFR